MDNAKPLTIPQYADWLEREHGVRMSRAKMRNHYDSVVFKIKDFFESSDFWKQLCSDLGDHSEEYLSATGYPLLVTADAPKVLAKDFDRFFHKTFRKNVVQNSRWPDPPEGGWVVPDNWYRRVGDVVRTLLVVKYLDGVGFMTQRIRSLCEDHRLQCDISFEAREEGYYAAHVGVVQRVEVPRVSWDTEMVDAQIEIQLTTQLQEVIRKLLHTYYERRREGIAEAAVKWQWDYRGEEFVANYLGHILHYTEGMIMEVRDRQSASRRPRPGPVSTRE